jgi:hypothetical protein
METRHAAISSILSCRFDRRGDIRFWRDPAASADLARILFFIAIVVFVVLLIGGLMAGSTLW